ncbi:MAG: M24 family metallopeptidase [Thermoplasmata archaeon]
MMVKIDYGTRWSKVKKVLEEKNADVYVSKLEGNMRYLALSDTPYHPASFGIVSYVLIPLKGEPVAITPCLEEFRAKDMLPIKNIKIFGDYPLIPSDGKKRNDLLKKVLTELTVKKVLFDSKENIDGFEIEEYDAVGKLRLQKEKEEIVRIKKAVSISDSAYEYLKNRLLNEGEMEREVARKLENYMRKKGIESVSFPAIVASGKNSAYSHHDNSSKKIKNGESVIVDYGACYEGYCSDITRTFMIGKIPKKLKEIYNIVLEANKKAISAARKGAEYKEIDEAARKVINESGYGRYFVHSTGHGIGLEVHESPRIAPTSEGKVSEGEVFTIEPGIYLPGLGGVRIEDMVYIGDDGTEVITKAEKKKI